MNITMVEKGGEIHPGGDIPPLGVGYPPPFHIVKLGKGVDIPTP